MFEKKPNQNKANFAGFFMNVRKEAFFKTFLFSTKKNIQQKCWQCGSFHDESVYFSPQILKVRTGQFDPQEDTRVRDPFLNGFTHTAQDQSSGRQSQNKSQFIDIFPDIQEKTSNIYQVHSE